MTYCFRCATCGAKLQDHRRELTGVRCPECGAYDLVRDWKAEGVQFTPVFLAEP